jgi:HYDIN/CFA65/VesB family protein
MESSARFHKSRALLNRSALFLSLVLCLAAQLSAAAQRPLPEAAIERARHDFGKVFAGEELSHTFIVRNVGNAPLELSDKQFLTPSRKVSTLLRDGFRAVSFRAVSLKLVARREPAAPS